jgi:hypothetical protein
MHASSHRVADPFGMLIDPQAIARALEGSQRLECLNRRICRPLDRVPQPKSDDSEAPEQTAERRSDIDSYE